MAGNEESALQKKIKETMEKEYRKGKSSFSINVKINKDTSEDVKKKIKSDAKECEKTLGDGSKYELRYRR
jgi:hypothetical protein